MRPISKTPSHRQEILRYVRVRVRLTLFITRASYYHSQPGSLSSTLSGLFTNHVVSLLPLEVLLFIVERLSYGSFFALRLTSKGMNALLDLPTTSSSSEMATNKFDYNMVDLLEIERWPCYNRASEAGEIPKQPIATVDYFACRLCLKIRMAKHFSNAMMKGGRGKGSLNHGSERTKRFCIPCGVSHGLYQRGTSMQVGGALSCGGGYGIVCLDCGLFKQQSYDCPVHESVPHAHHHTDDEKFRSA